jgi:hypothetical protein
MSRELVGDEPVPDRRVIRMDVHGGVDQVRVGPIPVGDRLGAPGIERLGGEAQDPAGHRDGDPVGGQVETSG